jgi:TolB protein
MNANGGEATFLTTGTGGSDSDPVWSPDGSKIAFTRNIDGNWGIHVMNADGTGVKRLASPFPQLCSGGSWSPDGLSLIASCTDDQIYLLYVDGTTPPKRLTTGKEQYMTPTWSPDGSKIAFVRYWQPGEVYQIYLMNSDGSGVRRISDGTGNDFGPAWGPKLKP